MDDPVAQRLLDSRRYTATISGTRVAFWRCGDRTAPAAIMLHGLGSDHTGLLDVAARLRGMQIVLPDLPGFGQSEPLPTTHSLRRYAAVIDELRRHLELPRIALLGHSLGADIALVYAGVYRRGLDALCLLNPVVAADSARARLSGWYYELCAALPAAIGRLLLTSRAAVYLLDRAMFATEDSRTRARILELDYATAQLAEPRAILDCYRSVRLTQFGRYAQRLGSPTLLVTGDDDALATPNSLRRLPWRHPATRLEVVPGGGHLLPVERPDLIAGLVQRFVDEHVVAR